jgi:hypothetical protein
MHAKEAPNHSVSIAGCVSSLLIASSEAMHVHAMHVQLHNTDLHSMLCSFTSSGCCRSKLQQAHWQAHHPALQGSRSSSRHAHAMHCIACHVYYFTPEIRENIWLFWPKPLTALRCTIATLQVQDCTAVGTIRCVEDECSLQSAHHNLQVVWLDAHSATYTSSQT